MRRDFVALQSGALFCGDFVQICKEISRIVYRYLTDVWLKWYEKRTEMLMHRHCTLVFLHISLECYTFAASKPQTSSHMKKPTSILLTLLSFLAVSSTMSCRRAIVAEGYQHTIVDTIGEFVVSYDTLYIDPSLLTPNTYLDVLSVVRYHDRYYCYCIEKPYRSLHTNTQEHLFSFTTDGRDFRDLGDARIGFPLVRNDSLLSITDDYVFYLDTLSWQWDSISAANTWNDESLVFNEDDDYYFAFEDHGEWGYYTSFISKATGQDYVWFMYPKRLFKYDNRYFNLLPTALQWVDDPTKGVEHPGKFLELKYEESKACTFIWAENDEYLSDFFFDFDTSYLPDTVFLNAFVWDNVLHFLTNTHDETCIARWQNDSSLKVMSFGHRFDFNHYIYSGIGDNSHLPRNEAVLWFNDNYRTSGIVDVVDNQIHISYLECDVDTTIYYLGVDSFESILSFYKENFSNLTPERVDSFEHQIGAVKNRVEAEPAFDRRYSYYHPLDSVLSLHIDVDYPQADCSPRCVDFSLTSMRFVEDGDNYLPFFSDSVDPRIWDVFYRQFGDKPDEKNDWSISWNKSDYQFCVSGNGTRCRFWNEKYK